MLKLREIQVPFKTELRGEGVPERKMVRAKHGRKHMAHLGNEWTLGSIKYNGWGWFWKDLSASGS